MAKEIHELKRKKKKLEEELQAIQGELDNSLDQVRSEVSSNLDPKTYIRKYPFPIIGAAALLGFLVGHKRNTSSKKSSSKNSSSIGISSMLISELKRIATKKAVSFASDYVEEFLERKSDEHLPSANDEKKV